MIMKRMASKCKEVEGIEKLFALYANATTCVIDPVGMQKLWYDLGIEHTDVRVALLLAWKLKAMRSGYFTHDEWCAGMKSLKADTLKKLKKRLLGLQHEVAKKEKLKEFYCHAFCSHLTDYYPVLDIKTACSLLQAVLGPVFAPQVNAFVKYLQILKEHQFVNMETWIDFYRFCHEIDFPDLSNYDENDTWCGVICMFVDALR
ncbi:putative defective-in-cullin neddylation protein [Helianthus annuus]|nr:putative defective-in-cullin neddylation protein [Helianthus annuus]KAJ0937138.1 putative defective-in-cullin neddylation protein [Helianthus annuus]KAJ0945079.1 putative defective-in-cullin neddylation protein [Helianthus annuus]